MEELALKRMGAWIRARRESRGMTLEQVAVLAGLNKATILRLEAGKTAKLSTMQRVAATLDLELMQLVLQAVPGPLAATLERFATVTGQRHSSSDAAVRITALTDENERLRGWLRTFLDARSRLNEARGLAEQAARAAKYARGLEEVIARSSNALVEAHDILGEFEIAELVQGAATSSDLLVPDRPVSGVEPIDGAHAVESVLLHKTQA